MFVLLIVIILVLLYYVDYCTHNSKDGKIFNKIPGPKTLPILGNVWDIITCRSSIGLFYKSLHLTNTYKDIYKLWILNMREVHIYDPHDMEALLSSSKNIRKGYVYDFLHPWLQDGLLTSTGEKWHKRRKILTPAFHFNILRTFCKIFDEQSKCLVEDLKAEVGKSETDVTVFVTKFALNSICETAMGTQIDADSRIVKEYKKSIYTMGELLMHRIINPYLHNPLLFKLSPESDKHKRELSVLHKFTTDVIRERRTLREPSDTEVTPVNDDDFGIRKAGKRLAMLDLLLKAEDEDKIDENGIREEVDTFMFEGHDTTSMGLSFSLMLLANHPEAQERIVAECNEIIEDPNREVTIDDLNRMRYLEKCLKECLRLYPSVPFISRRSEEEVQLKNYIVPADTMFHLHIYNMHRDARLFPNPDVFDPERFTPENCAKRHPFAYIPFSAGPRNCIGQKYALLEEKAIISAILRNYKLEAITTPDDIVFIADLVLRCKYPIKVKFLPR